MAFAERMKSTNPVAWIHSTRVHVVLYVSLVVATPFMMLQVYMQDAVHLLSVLKVELWGQEILVVPAVAVISIIGGLVLFRRSLTKIRLLGALVAFLMIASAQQVADLYLNLRFYDIQQNWHYFAYALFAYILYRDLRPRGISWERLIRYAYIIALSASIFDEAFQMEMSHRIFDISDIAKDGWGVLIGLVLICFWADHSFFLTSECRRLRHSRLRDYFVQPVSLLFLLMVMTFLLIFYSSLLTELEYWKHIVAFTLLSTAVLLFLVHISQFKWGKMSLIVVLFFLILIQNIAKNRCLPK